MNRKNESLEPVYTHGCAHARVWAHTHFHTCMHAHIHTCKHTYTHMHANTHTHSQGKLFVHTNKFPLLMAVQDSQTCSKMVIRLCVNKIFIYWLMINGSMFNNCLYLWINCFTSLIRWFWMEKSEREDFEVGQIHVCTSDNNWLKNEIKFEDPNPDLKIFTKF